MYALLLDALAALRLRFAPAAHYRYSAPVVAAALLVVGALNAAAIAPIFGNSPAVIMVSLCLTVLKWLLLSTVMAALLRTPGTPKMRLFGFIAMTEVLAAPLVAMLYWPQELGLLGMLWQSWIFVVQIIGLIRLSNRDGLKVLLGYAAYMAALLLCASLLLLLAHSAGWVDIEALAQQMQQGMQQAPR